MKELVNAVREKLDGRLIIMHGNRLAASVSHLVEIGAIPPLDYAFTAVAGGARHVAQNVFALEDESDEHPDLVWGHAPYEQMIEELLDQYVGAVLLCTYRKPMHDDIQRRHGDDIIVACPPSPIAAEVENKSRLHRILGKAGAKALPAQVFDDASDIPSYKEMSKIVGPEMVLQIVASAGGARHDLKSSVNFVTNEAEFEEAKAFQAGHGQIKVVRYAPGRETNGAGCTLPGMGVYVDPPSHKPVGTPELYGRKGSGAGNDWTWPHDAEDLAMYQKVLQGVGQVIGQRGFTGCYGVDSIFPGAWAHEINGRSQGTTENQEVTDLRDGAPSLPLLAIAHQLGVDPELFPDAEAYNKQSLNRPGGWYLKVNVPKPVKVPEDLNGVWTIDNGQLTGKHNGSPLDAARDEVYIYGAPQAGKIALPASGLPTLYVNGLPGSQAVFDADDSLTPFGETVRRAVYKALGLSEGEY